MTIGVCGGSGSGDEGEQDEGMVLPDDYENIPPLPLALCASDLSRRRYSALV